MGKPGAAVRAAGWVAVGAIAAGGVATAATTTGGSSKPASATTTATTPSTTQPAPAAKGKGARKGLAARLRGRLLHGQATVLGKDGKPVVVAEQRGTVSAVSAVTPTSITLTSKDGFKQTYVVNSATLVRVDGKKSSIGNVKTGQPAGVVAKVDGGTQTAVIIIERAPKAAPAS
jgi:hypothetical protein